MVGGVSRPGWTAIRDRLLREMEYRDLLGRAQTRSVRRRDWIPYDVSVEEAMVDYDDVFMTDNDVFSEDDADLQAAIDFSLMPEFSPELRCNPAADAEVAGLPVKILAAPNEAPCVICLETVAQGDTCFDLGCGHDMHEACMREWFRYGRLCPSCRKPLFAA